MSSDEAQNITRSHRALAGSLRLKIARKKLEPFSILRDKQIQVMEDSLRSTEQELANGISPAIETLEHKSSEDPLRP
jgi:hypothetical protein